MLSPPCSIKPNHFNRTTRFHEVLLHEDEFDRLLVSLTISFDVFKNAEPYCRRRRPRKLPFCGELLVAGSESGRTELFLFVVATHKNDSGEIVDEFEVRRAAVTIE